MQRNFSLLFSGRISVPRLITYNPLNPPQQYKSGNTALSLVFSLPDNDCHCHYNVLFSKSDLTTLELTR